MAQEVVHGCVQARVAHGQQHEGRVARQGQEIAEQDQGEEGGLQRRPVGETQQQEALLGAVVGLQEESPRVPGKAQSERVTLCPASEGEPGSSGRGWWGTGREGGARGSMGEGMPAHLPVSFRDLCPGFGKPVLL